MSKLRSYKGALIDYDPDQSAWVVYFKHSTERWYFPTLKAAKESLTYAVRP